MARTPNAVCTVCGKSYWRQPNRLANSRFCSNECKNAGKGFREDELIHLYYEKQWSMQQIADHHGCSLKLVYYWMEKYGLERRDSSEATYLHYNPEGDPFRITMPETAEDWKLFGIGIGLYMGEGTKTGWAVRLANSNPGIHRIFLLFLRKFCGVQRDQIRAELNIYNDCNIDHETQWWSNELSITVSQFFQPTIREKRGGTYKNKSPHGTLTVIFSNVKLKKIIEDWCSEYYL